MINFIKQIKEEPESAFINRKKDFITNDIVVSENEQTESRSTTKTNNKDLSESNTLIDPSLITEDILNRQAKTLELLNRCDIVDEKISTLKNILISQTKEVSKTVDISKDPIVLAAARKVFKKNAKVITKEMYLEAVDKLRTLQNKTIELK